jgi:hypothetical protein
MLLLKAIGNSSSFKLTLRYASPPDLTAIPAAAN